MRLSDRVIVMDDGHVITEGVPEVVRHDPRVIEAYLGHRRPAEEAAPHTKAQLRPAAAPHLVIDPALGVL
jgi:branched-chain amino acid transport system ATP-binding protein